VVVVATVVVVDDTTVVVVGATVVVVVGATVVVVGATVVVVVVGATVVVVVGATVVVVGITGAEPKDTRLNVPPFTTVPPQLPRVEYWPSGSWVIPSLPHRYSGCPLNVTWLWLCLP